MLRHKALTQNVPGVAEELAEVLIAGDKRDWTMRATARQSGFDFWRWLCN